MRTHVKVLAWLFLAIGALELLAALAMFGLFAGVGLIGGLASGELFGFLGPSVVGGFISVVIGITALPELIAGFGLLRLRNWARILGILLAVLNLFKFPYGTLLGIYAIWVLTRGETKALMR